MNLPFRYRVAIAAVLVLASSNAGVPGQDRIGAVAEERAKTTIACATRMDRLANPAANERTTTENFCSLGIRILTQRARELNERLWVSSLDEDLRTLARVVYCQRLPDGRFGVGLQFQEQNRQPVRAKSGYLESATCLPIIVPRSRGGSADSERQLASAVRGALTAW
jgi:hypothetical protein